MSSRSGTSRRGFLIGSAAAGGMLALNPAAAKAEAFHGSSADIARAVSLAIANTLREGLTDVPWLPRPFELQLLTGDQQTRRDVALRAAEIVAKQKFDPANFAPVEWASIPKRHYRTRRTVAVIEPVDHIVYLALALMAAPAIEESRIPRERDVAFSYRLAPKQGRLFDPEYRIQTFLKASRDANRAGKFVVGCDVANFYGHLPPERIASALESSAVEPWIADYLVATLDHWNCAAEGLPCGSNSSRILAEAHLNRIDRKLEAQGVTFSRFVDDFRIVADEPSVAARQVELLRALLADEGMHLNPIKTRVWPPKGAEAGGDAVYDRLAQIPPPYAPPPGPGNPGPLLPNEIPQFPDNPGPLLPNELPRPDDDGLPLPVLPGRRNRRFDRREDDPSRGVVPRFVRRPSDKELAKIRAAGVPDAALLLEGPLPLADEIRAAVRQAVFTGGAEFVRTLPRFLARCPEFTSYVVSALVKGADHLPSDARADVARDLAEQLFDANMPDFVKPPILALIAHPLYRQRGAIERFARAASPEPRGLYFRASLDALRATGGIPAELHAVAERTDGWGRRALMADALVRGSKIPSETTDLFAVRMAALCASSRDLKPLLDA